MAPLQTAQITGEQFRAQIVPGSINEEKRTVDLIWSTGARVLRGFFSPFWEELSMKPKHIRMERLKSGNAPLLNSHRSGGLEDVLGVVEKASIKKGEGHATVRFSKEPHAESVFRDVVDKIVRNVSVGYQTFSVQETTDVQGDLPVRLAIDWEPHEISMVPVGADAGASVRNSAPLNTCTLVAAEPDQEQRAMDSKDAPITTPATPVAAPAPVAEVRSAVPVAAPAITAEQKAAIAAGERKRIEEIRSAAKVLKVGAVATEAAIGNGLTTADEFRATHIETFEARSAPGISDAAATPSVTAGDDAQDKFARGVQNWLIVRSGLGSKVIEAAKLRGETIDLDPGEFRGMSLMDVGRASLRHNGQDSTGIDRKAVAGRALSFRGGGGGYASVSDFPVLLENTMHKLLLAAWGITPDTWRRFCKIGSVTDFRPHNRFRQGTFSSLDVVIPGAEYTNKSVPDGRKETIAVQTRGNIVMIDRQTIINDDMDAFTSIAMQLGRAAKLTIEKDAYAALAENAGLGPLMADGNPLFDASHDNLGTNAALAMASVEADRVVMKIQKDESSNEILDLVPKILLVAAGLGGTARQVNEAQYDLADVGGFAPNVALGLYDDIIDTGRMTGTARYSFADPSTAPVLEVAFLDGKQEPTMEMQDGYRIDGTSWKVSMDYEVGAIGYRGAVYNSGTP